MEYKLAKELKDGGFPQQNHDASRCDLFQSIDKSEECHCSPYTPDLEELIEACGEHFDAVGKTVEGSKFPWMAFKDTSPKSPEGLGNTPLEAVARLWLSLHKSNERTAPTPPSNI